MHYETPVIIYVSASHKTHVAAILILNKHLSFESG